MPWALGGGQRQSLGAWFTPPAIADDLAAATLGTAHRPGVSDADPAAQLRRLRALRILDPPVARGPPGGGPRWMVQRERDLLRALGDIDGRPQVHAGQLRGLTRTPGLRGGAVALRHAASQLGCAGDPQLVVQDALLAKGPAPRAPVWPDADVVVSNPPFIGSKRLRVALGDARVESLWAAWPSVPRQADLALFWWNRCAALLHAGALQRAGFITTSSIRQPHNRRVVQRWLDALALLHADPDRAWSPADASVRVALTVLALPTRPADPRRPVGWLTSPASARSPNMGRCFMGVTSAGASRCAMSRSSVPSPWRIRRRCFGRPPTPGSCCRAGGAAGSSTSTGCAWRRHAANGRASSRTWNARSARAGSETDAGPTESGGGSSGNRGRPSGWPLTG